MTVRPDHVGLFWFLVELRMTHRHHSVSTSPHEQQVQLTAYRPQYSWQGLICLLSFVTVRM